MNTLVRILFFFFLLPQFTKAQAVILRGRVSATPGPVYAVTVKLKGSSLQTSTDREGRFELKLPVKPSYQISFSHVSFTPQLKTIRAKEGDTLYMETLMTPKTTLLDTVPVFAVNKPETLVGKPDYSVIDFDFHEDQFLLLCPGRRSSDWFVRLSDHSGSVSAEALVPKAAGRARYFFHDYEGYTDLICDNRTYRVTVLHGEIILESISDEDFIRYLYPVSDTANNALYFHNHNRNYPAFSHFSIKAGDSVAGILKHITNEDLMRLYNLEYYYLPPSQRLQARRLAYRYNTDEHIVAALMSGFTQSMYYEPLFAPLFVLSDTICIFDHYRNHIYRFTGQGILHDSLPISYHHPKNWRDWKKQLLVDEVQEKVYACFGRDGRKYIKAIDHRTGREKTGYTLKNHSADRLKIRDAYVYYVYRPFGSTQETFLYRERIE